MRRATPLLAALALASACSLANSYPVGRENELALCFNGVDDDYDDLADCADPSCEAFCVERAAERCADGVDNDADGASDCDDPGCAAFCPATPAAPGVGFVAPDGTTTSPAALPVLTPCLPGWREISPDDGVAFCEPWPEGGRQDCDDFELHVPGTEGCAPVGTPCAEGRAFPDVTEGEVIYVAAGASGGDGTREAPFATIAEGVASLTSLFGTVALGPGTYDESTLSLSRSLTLRGVCAAETIVRAPIRMSSVTVALRDLTVEGVDGPAVLAVGNAELRLEGVVVAGAEQAGVWTVDSAVIGHEVLIRDTRLRRFTEDEGYGLRLDGGDGYFERLEVRQSAALGVLADGGNVILIDTSIHGTQGFAGYERGYAASAIRRGAVSAVGAVFEDNAAGALVCSNCEALVEDSVLRGGVEGPGYVVTVAVIAEGLLQGRRMRVEAWNGPAVFADDGDLDLTDCTFTGAPAGTPSFAGALTVAGPKASIDGTAVLVDRRGADGLQCALQAQVSMRDLTMPGSAATASMPVVVREGGLVSLSRAELGGGSHGLGADRMMLSLLPTRVELGDVWIHDAAGAAVVALDGVDLVGTGVVVERARGAGLVARASDVSLDGFLFRDIEVDAAACASGVETQDTALSLANGRVERVARLGVSATDGSATLHDVALELGLAPCEGDCSGARAPSLGAGVALYQGTSAATAGPADVTDVTVAEAGACGVVLSPTREVSLLRTSVARTPFTVCTVGSGEVALDGVWPADESEPVVRTGGRSPVACVPSSIYE